MQKYNEKKATNQVIARYTKKHVTPKTQKRIEECANWIEMLADFELERMKINRANFCKTRFCTFCAYRKAMKDAMKLAAMMGYIESVHKKAFLFLTLTAPNVKAQDLPQTIDKFNEAFKNLCKRDCIADINHGYIRKLEVTYDNYQTITWRMWNGDKRGRGSRKEHYKRRGLKIGDKNPNYDTYHPHFHVVMAVDSHYFTSRKYIKHDRFLAEWRDVMGNPDITQVHVQRVKRAAKSLTDESTPSEQAYGTFMYELAKYAAKDSEYGLSQEVFDGFYNGLKGRQVLTFNGLFTDANKKYKNHELDKYLSVDSTEYCYLLMYLWGKGEYVEKSRVELTSD